MSAKECTTCIRIFCTTPTTGPTCIEDAIEIARIAAANGTRVMLATPHRKDVTELSSVPRLYELAAELQYRFDDEGIPLSL